MENPFVFDWMFDILSLGTTYLYRKYMIGAHLTMMLAAEEDVWRVPPTWDDVTAESPFQSAYDELDIDLDSKHPSRHLNRWPDEREEDEFELRQDDDKRLSIEIEELGEPPTNQHVYGVTARIHAPDTHPAVAITTASCSPESPRPQAATQEPLVCEDNLLSATIIENCDDMRVIHGDHQVMVIESAFIRLESIPEESETPSECGSEMEAEYPNNLLLHFQRDRRSLVLDSARPHLAPHLVITPPDDHCQDSCPFPIDAGTRCPTHSPNFLERQCRRDLSVPRPHGRLPSHSRPRKISHSSFKGNVEYRRLPYRVFSHREFADSVAKAAEERSMFLDLADFVQKLQCKANAFHVSRKARWYRKRYRDPSFFKKIEPPFKWSDPGEPILYAYAKSGTTIVIDSFRPFSAPHIMITEPTSHDPETRRRNLPTNPQDYRWGGGLTVMFETAMAINLPYAWFTSFSDSDSQSEDGEAYYVLPDGAPSRAETPLPATPLTVNSQLETVLDEDGYVDDEEGREYASFLEDSSPISTVDSMDSSTLNTPYDDRRVVHDIYNEEDEEDDLPPFDDWYTSIQSRTQAN